MHAGSLATVVLKEFSSLNLIKTLQMAGRAMMSLDQRIGRHRRRASSRHQ